VGFFCAVLILVSGCGEAKMAGSDPASLGSSFVNMIKPMSESEKVAVATALLTIVKANKKSDLYSNEIPTDNDGRELLVAVNREAVWEFVLSTAGDAINGKSSHELLAAAKGIRIQADRHDLDRLLTDIIRQQLVVDKGPSLVSKRINAKQEVVEMIQEIEGALNSMSTKVNATFSSFSPRSATALITTALTNTTEHTIDDATVNIIWQAGSITHDGTRIALKRNKAIGSDGLKPGETAAIVDKRLTMGFRTKGTAISQESQVRFSSRVYEVKFTNGKIYSLKALERMRSKLPNLQADVERAQRLVKEQQKKLEYIKSLADQVVKKIGLQMQ